MYVFIPLEGNENVVVYPIPNNKTPYKTIKNQSNNEKNIAL